MRTRQDGTAHYLKLTAKHQVQVKDGADVSAEAMANIKTILHLKNQQKMELAKLIALLM